MSEERLFYVISYKHSSGGILTFWRANNRGYTTDLSQAGKYPESVIRESFDYYNDQYDGGGIQSKAIPVDDIEKYYRVVHQVESNWLQKNKHSILTKKKVLFASELKKQHDVPSI